jgi:hypothetical protein
MIVVIFKVIEEQDVDTMPMDDIHGEGALTSSHSKTHLIGHYRLEFFGCIMMCILSSYLSNKKTNIH